MRTTVSITVIGVAALMAGCPGQLEDPERFNRVMCPPDTNVVTDIFYARCGSRGCHEGAMPAGGLDLTVADPAAQMVGVPADHPDCAGRDRIDPDNVDDSVLLDKLSSAPTCGDSMPLVGSRLTNVELVCVREWVLEQVGGAGDGGVGADGGADDGGADAGADAGPDAGADAGGDAGT